MPPPLSDELREAILADIRTGELTRNAIARKHDVAQSTVTRLAQQTDQPDAFDRSQTKEATRALTADFAERRAKLAKTMLDLAEHVAARAKAPTKLYLSTATGVEVIKLEEPQLSDVRQAMTSIGIAIDKHVVLVKHDADPGVDAAKSMLGALAAGLQAAYDALPSAETPDADRS